MTSFWIKRKIIKSVDNWILIQKWKHKNLHFIWGKNSHRFKFAWKNTWYTYNLKILEFSGSFPDSGSRPDRAGSSWPLCPIRLDSTRTSKSELAIRKNRINRGFRVLIRLARSPIKRQMSRRCCRSLWFCSWYCWCYVALDDDDDMMFCCCWRESRSNCRWSWSRNCWDRCIWSTLWRWYSFTKRWVDMVNEFSSNDYCFLAWLWYLCT
jgi:hypothetical protein